MIAPKLLAFLALLAARIILLCTPRLAGAASPTRLLADSFQGKWKVTVEPDEDARKAGEKTFEDTLVFQGGQFTAEACKKRGFGPCTYEEDTRRFGPATFTAEPTSEKEGKAKWTGTLMADQIQGELTWTKKDGTVLHYQYKGSKAT